MLQRDFDEHGMSHYQGEAVREEPPGLIDEMDEEEQFVNIDLNDDNICSVCKLETETGTLSFCHVCFELSIE
ncbi:hypothetical protein CHARACLAT_007899, partial [Characodon lateralis]|nr:hypothetical protein [Characodon lateralis]